MENTSKNITCKLEHVSGVSKKGNSYNMYVLRFPEANASIVLKGYGDYEHYKIKQLLKEGE